MSGEHGKYARPLAPCGSDAAYHRHLRHGETPCQPCKEAHWAALREWYQRSPRSRARAEEADVPIPEVRDFDWASRAACRDADPKPFTLTNRTARAPKDAWVAAAKHCRVCPVLAQCGQFADRHEYEGLWSGIYRIRRTNGGDYLRFPVLSDVDTAVGRHPSVRKGRAA